MATAQEVDAMRRAIALSAFGLGTTSPNPPVGCVILDPDGRVIGEGFHERKGEPHAEAHALAAAGRHAKNATAVVTLEPCNHVGRTPACRQLLIDAGIRRVVIAIMDPTSRGEGGAAVLRKAGIDVQVGILTNEASLVLGSWLAALDMKRPVVTWAYAADETSIAAPGPDLAGALRQNTDVVLHENGRVEEGMPGSHGPGMLQLPPEPLRAEPHAALDTLFRRGARTLLLLGGPSLAEPFLGSGLVDRVLVYVKRRDNRSLPSASPAYQDRFRLTRVGRTAGYVATEYCVENSPK